MKKYIVPEMEIEEVSSEDIMTNSSGNVLAGKATFTSNGEEFQASANISDIIAPQWRDVSISVLFKPAVFCGLFPFSGY